MPSERRLQPDRGGFRRGLTRAHRGLAPDSVHDGWTRHHHRSGYEAAAATCCGRTTPGDHNLDCSYTRVPLVRLLRCVECESEIVQIIRNGPTTKVKGLSELVTIQRRNAPGTLSTALHLRGVRETQIRDIETSLHSISSRADGHGRSAAFAVLARRTPSKTHPESPRFVVMEGLI